MGFGGQRLLTLTGTQARKGRRHDVMMISFIRWEISFSDQSGTIYRTSVMNNYFGIGLEAAIALDFHNAREENPDKFNSRCVCMLASDVFITMVT